MSRLGIKLLAVTGLVAGASVVGTSAAWALIAAEDFGTGATAAAAQHAATVALHGDYFGCNTPTLVYDIQLSDGTWSAEVAAACKGVN